MSRPLRIQYPGAVYHITCRGNERKEIFRDDKDRSAFLETLQRSKIIYSIKLYAYVLMNNHFHLLVETPLGNLGEAMRQFNITYTSYFNRRHRRVGHLYQGRYKSILVEKDEYLSVLSRYIHLNPVRTTKMKGNKEKLKYLIDYPWSSLKGYIDHWKKEKLIDYDLVLGEYGGDSAKGRKAYRQRIAEDATEGLEIRDKIIGQHILGGDRFIEWVREQFVSEEQKRETPSITELKRYGAQDKIIRGIEEVTGKSIRDIRVTKGALRQVVMDLLYRIGGMNGREIGKLLGVDYSTVSQGKERLHEKLKTDKKLRVLISEIETHLSM